MGEKLHTRTLKSIFSTSGNCLNREFIPPLNNVPYGKNFCVGLLSRTERADYYRSCPLKIV